MPPPKWRANPTRTALLALYRQADALLRPFSCPGSTDCCRFAVTGREPYPTSAELAELLDAAAASGALRAQRRRLPLADRRCPLLGADDRCRVYASRPFGCRTFFCDRVTGPGRLPRAELAELGRRIADLSARAFPRDPHPRPLGKALADVPGAARRLAAARG